MNTTKNFGRMINLSLFYDLAPIFIIVIYRIAKRFSIL